MTINMVVQPPHGSSMAGISDELAIQTIRPAARWMCNEIGDGEAVKGGEVRLPGRKAQRAEGGRCRILAPHATNIGICPSSEHSAQIGA